MRRVRFYEHGGPEVLRLEEAEPPEPGPGEILVRTEAIGVKLPSVRRVRGGSPLPGVLAGEVAGRVAALGPDVTGFAVGERVTGLCFTGAYADMTTIPAALASPVPDEASASQAVALVGSGQVALAALRSAGSVRGEAVLVTAAASGVGHLAVQLARLQGASRVVAAVGSPAKAGFLKELGADEVVTYDDEGWGEPVDIVLDAVGGDLLPRALAVLAPFGRLVVFSSGGGAIAAHELLAGAKTVVGMPMARVSAAHPELMEQRRRELWELAFSGRLRAVVHAELPLDRAAEAHALGKAVLRTD